MSTPERPNRVSTVDPSRVGLPTRDQGEHEATNDWTQAEVDDRASAIEGRLGREEAYEQYDGPLPYSAWLRERVRAEQLESLGIERQELPEAYREALGSQRAERLERQIEDRMRENATSPPSREELAAQARQFGAAARALNLELSTRVVGLEEKHAELGEQLSESRRTEFDLSDTGELLDPGEEQERVLAAAEAQRAVTEALTQSRNMVGAELDELSTRDDHPDRWVKQNGKTFFGALAARAELRRQREQTAAERASADSVEVAPGADQQDRRAERAPEAPDVGMDPF